MNPLLQCKPTILPLFIAAVLACFGLLPKALAVVPPPDGGYPGFNTAEGQKALFSLTTGVANTAVGWFALFSNAEGSFNTATGAGALLFNTADNNTGLGAAALLFNTIGGGNTAVGTAALLNNTEGGANTGNGVQALYSNITGGANTANGYQALFSNATGNGNTANGYQALLSNTTGSGNTANGFQSLRNNTMGGSNTAIGEGALEDNIAGNENTALGATAGSNITGNGNVCIGAGVNGEAGVNDSTYVRNVNTTVQSGGGFDTVTVRLADGRLGHAVSSRRYKENIQSIDKASEALFALQPVMFRYTKQVDPDQGLDYGLIAEDVAKVAPELAVRDREGKICNYRRDAINALLLNEFLKEHRKVQELEANAARQQKQIEALIVGLQKVSDQLELSKPATQVVKNNQ